MVRVTMAQEEGFTAVGEFGTLAPQAGEFALGRGQVSGTRVSPCAEQGLERPLAGAAGFEML